MRLLLLGPPGAGKGTQATLISHRYQIPHISSGNMLRQAIESSTPIGKSVEDAIKQGQLVTDDLIIKLVEKRIQQSDCINGFVLDGFPRTLSQTKSLTQIGIYLDYLIEIRLTDEKIIQRLSGRRIHPGSGRTYHLLYHPPKRPGVDDITQELLIQRKDDQEDVIRKRIATYHEQKEPMINYYLDLAHHTKQIPAYFAIDGQDSIENIHHHMIKILNQTQP